MSRIVFVSGTTTGGSGRSQRELAEQLVARGHDVLFLVDDKRPAKFHRWLYEALSDISVRLGDSWGSTPVSRLRDSIQRTTTETLVADLRHLTTAYPQNALPSILDQFLPDVVVANSVERWAWRRIHSICRQHRVPTILYVREEDSLPHLATGCLPSCLLTNTPSLTATLQRQGYACTFIPSVVNLDITRTSSTREVALAINPIAIKGGDFVWDVAQHTPDIPIVLQEAWSLPVSEVARIEARRVEAPHVAFRRRQAPGPELYKDARVLLAPYRVDSRPRVILEAQSNGIPVIAADVPALREAVGNGGVILPLHAGAWAETLVKLWTDDQWYAELSAAASAHSQRSEVAPHTIAAQFEHAVNAAVDSGANSR